MNLDTFLLLERQNLESDRRGLLESDRESDLQATVKPGVQITASSDVVKAQSGPREDFTIYSIAGEDSQTPSAGTGLADAELLKSAKEWANHREIVTTNVVRNGNETMEIIKPEINLEQQPNKDDMEQWVTDTFYSYFPGFTNEYQKRQENLRKRQWEYQQNFIKHQMLQTPQIPQNADTSSFGPSNEQCQYSSQNRFDTSVNPSSQTTLNANKTDLEIIVTNPNYQPSKYINSRPNTTRHKLLRDLGHTALSSNADESNAERNQRAAELETNRKKEYQRDLMQQIEEKRQTVAQLREKERLEEEALTRRLQEQLKTIRLEEQLAKEKLRIEKIRNDAAQSRLMRAQLLVKLENDTLMLRDNKSNLKLKAKEDNVENSKGEHKNKVYKYFSNSARREYRRDQPINDINLSLDLASSLAENECFHLSDKICPKCNAPLKSYENYCLHCQQILRSKYNDPRTSKVNNGEDSLASGKSSDSTNSFDESVREETPALCVESGEQLLDKRAESKDMPLLKENSANFLLACHKCECVYSLCQVCVARKDVCRACHRKLNVCMNCRRALCGFCLNEIASGRDTERLHINEIQLSNTHNKNDSSASAYGERSFCVLEVNRDAGQKHQEEASNNSPLNSGTYDTNVTFRHIYNNLRDGVHQPSSFVNNDVSIGFSPDLEPIDIQGDKPINFDVDSPFSSTDEQTRIERVRRQTDKRLSQYLKNYGDLARFKQQKQGVKSESQHRGTQTTSDSMGRRDIILHEEHNLSMPLLREMPKMTRNECSKFAEYGMVQRNRKIDCLKQRWEVPAVQKLIISQEPPHILTQVGAIRKQLQTERIQSDTNCDA